MIWVLVAVVVVLLAIIGVLLARQQRSRKLKADFGPEYDRVVAERGDQRSGENELASRRRRVSEFEIRPLAPADRERYVERWGRPSASSWMSQRRRWAEAHLLVQRVMHDRGYPVDEDFQQRAADLSLDHPDVVENYRAAHSISLRAQQGQADTEQLRQAMVHFRALFDDLLAPSDGTPARDGDPSEQAAVQHETTRRS